MTKTLETIIAGSVTRIEDTLLRKATLNQDQYENLRLNGRFLNDFWQLEDLEKFISDLQEFMFRNLQTGDFQIWMDAFKILSRNNYPRDLKGFLTSIDTSKSMNLDFSTVKPLEWFLMNRSGLKHQKKQPIFQSK